MSPASTHRNSPAVSLFTSWMIALACAFCLAIPTGYSYGSALLCLTSIPLLIYLRPSLSLDFDDKVLLVVLALSALTVVLLNLYHDLSSRYYEEASRYFFAFFIVLLLLACPPRAAFWWGALALGAIASGCLALWQVFIQDMPRAEGFLSQIQFGNLSLLLAALCLTGIGWAYQRRHLRCWVTVLMIAAVFGITASLLSGSRGGWLALPLVLAILYLGYRTQVRRRLLAGGIALLVVLLGLLYVTPQTGVQARIHLATVELGDYVGDVEVSSSLGFRLEMWRASVQLARQHPLLGWGVDNYIAPMQALVADPQASRIIGRFSHVHNELLDALVKYGLVGVVFLLLIYLVPLVIFSRQLLPKRGGQNREVRAFALAGVILVVCVLVFGLSQAFFRHNSGLTVYIFFVTVIWGYLRDAQRRAGALTESHS